VEENLQGGHKTKLPEPNLPFSKEVFLSVRLDFVTKRLLEIASKKLGKRMSTVVRSALWLTFILLDPDTTLRKILKIDAIDRVCKGEDIAFIDALKPVDEFAKELVELALRLPPEEEE
jgi:hypothetical protein